MMGEADIAGRKRALRAEIRKTVREMTPEYLAESDALIYNHLLGLPEFREAQVVFTYYSVGGEPDTRRIVALALSQGKTVGLPRCYENGRMEAKIIRSVSELVPGEYDIPTPPDDAQTLEPSRIELAIIPALAFSRDGRRLGQGGGYYDRFLNGAGFLSVGLTRERFFLDEIPFEAHDARLNCVITEKGIARLR